MVAKYMRVQQSLKRRSEDMEVDMELVYKISVVGFDNVPHQESFHRKWLAEGGSEGLMNEARKLIRGERQNNRYSSQPSHGRAPQRMPGWEHVGCLGSWMRGGAGSANCHCLEVMKDPNGKFFLVDQAEHGDFSGHTFDSTVICEVPTE